jgi:hypothetical protein
MIDFNSADRQGAPRNVHPLPAAPNVEAMRSMVDDIFRYAAHGLVELAWTDTSPPFAPRNAQLFGLEELDALVEHAAKLNAAPFCNVYVSPGLRREGTPRGKRADDAAVSSVAAIKADFDNPGALDEALQVLAKNGLTPNRVVITSRRPYLRGQIWFLLDEPCSDLQTGYDIEDHIAKALGGDASVKNPSRIMRLAGSIAWPVKKGRTRELTELVTAGLREAPYTIDELATAVRRLAKPSRPEPETDILDFNTAARQGGSSLDEYVIAAREPGQWHENVLKAVAHLTRKGAPPDTIVSLLSHAVTQPGYTISQTREEIAVMVRGAIRKGYVPKDAPAGDPETNKGQKATGHDLSGQWIDDLRYVYQPEIVEDLIPARGVGVVFGPSSAGKSFVVVDWAMEIASGGKVLGMHTTPSGVLYFAGEGQHGLKKRIVASRRERGLDDVVLPFNVLSALLDLSKSEAKDIDRLCAYAREIADEMKARGAPLRVVFIDTLAAAAPGANENAGEDMGPIMQAFHHMSELLGVVVVLVAHTGKDETRGIRGWSGIRANIDFAIECQVGKDPDTKKVLRRSLFLEKAKDGPDGFTLTDYDLSTVEMGKKVSGNADRTCVVEYSVPAGASSAAAAEQIERETQERMAALRRQVLDGMVASLGEEWKSARQTAIRLKDGGIKIGRNKLIDVLQTFASEHADDITAIAHAGVSIEVRTKRSDTRTTLHFRVAANA